MKKIKMFMFDGCPHCKRASDFLLELRKDAKYGAIEIDVIDEKKQPELADRYDYYYVPTFFVGGEKCHEGSVTLEQVQHVLDKALQ